MPTIELHDIELLDNVMFDLMSVLERTHIGREQLVEMASVGIFEPTSANPDQWCFPARDVERIRTAQRLMRDLGVNNAGAALILELLDERDVLLNRLALAERLLVRE